MHFTYNLFFNCRSGPCRWHAICFPWTGGSYPCWLRPVRDLSTFGSDLCQLCQIWASFFICEIIGQSSFSSCLLYAYLETQAWKRNGSQLVSQKYNQEKWIGSTFGTRTTRPTNPHWTDAWSFAMTSSTVWASYKISYNLPSWKY